VSEEFLDTLTRGLAELDISPDREFMEGCALHHEELKKWSKAYNITALKRDRDIAIKLFLDSLLYLKVLPDSSVTSRTWRLLDVGSGGGFPGLVLKIALPGMELILLEPSWKRVAFLRHMIKKLRLKDVTVVQSTLEEMVAQQEGMDLSVNPEKALFNVIVTRALFRTYEFMKKTEGIITHGGSLILGKGPGYKEELNEVKLQLGDESSGYTIETIPLKLPFTDITRYFIRIRFI
jgi:16S rRNA (guanine527-N7)-methyltransferase